MQKMMPLESSPSLKMMVYASLFSALMAAGAYIAVPVGPVPIVLQNMVVLMAGLLLGVRWGMAALLLYLFMGACGLPVFAGGTGGIGRLFGPTGGYLLGYIPAIWMTALLSQTNRMFDEMDGDFDPGTSSVDGHGGQDGQDGHGRRSTSLKYGNKVYISTVKESVLQGKKDASPTENRLRIGINFAAMTVGSLIVYAVGVPWLKMTTGMDWSKAVAAGMFPFLVGDAIKAFAGAMLAHKLAPFFRNRSHRFSGE